MKLFEYISEKDFLNLKPGDKLLVNTGLKAIERQYHIPYGYVSSMSKFEGEIVTVRELVSSKDDTTEGPFVVLEEDDGLCAWAPECFKYKVEKSFSDAPDDATTIGHYYFYYTPDSKIICKEETTGYTTTARCHEEDIFSVEVGQLVSLAHMLGYDVDHCGNNDRFSLIKKKPAYYYGEKVFVDTSHPDCPKAMKENYKDEIGIILSYSLDRKVNTYIYKVIFKDEKIYRLQENVLKNVPINFIPGAQDLKDTYVKVKKK